MRLFSLLVAGGLALYAASGFYVVKGNERAAVRLFGRAVRGSDGTLELVPSGLHYSLPWPFAAVDRVNVNEIRTLSIGVNDLEEDPSAGFLRALESVNQSQFLTGDKNVLHVQINAQYHVSEQAAADFLFQASAPERQLQFLIESVATDLFVRCGVDFVHPLGQVELNQMLTVGVQRLCAGRALGLEIDDVAIGAVYPPIVVKPYFLDVTSARADKVNSINEANAYAEKRRAASGAEARRILDEATGARHQTVESARARADSFTRMIDQFRSEERSGAHSYVEARQIALRRNYLDTMRDVLKTVSAKVLLDSGEPADLTIFSRAPLRQPAATPSSGQMR